MIAALGSIAASPPSAGPPAIPRRLASGQRRLHLLEHLRLLQHLARAAHNAQQRIIRDVKRLIPVDYLQDAADPKAMPPDTLREDLRVVLKSFEPNDLLLFARHYDDGADVAVLAGEFHLSKATIYARLDRMRKVIREKLNEGVL